MRFELLHSQHFIYFITYQWAQKSRVLVPCKLFQPSVMQHSNLLGPFLSYEENELLRIQPLITLINYLGSLGITLID